MSSLNQANLIGRVGKDPEVRSFQNGGQVATFSLATSDTWKDKTTGERQERTEWHTVAVFSEGLVKIVERYVSKGDRIFVQGALQTRKWQDKDGNDRYSTEVVLRGFGGQIILLSDKGASSGGGSAGGRQADNGGNQGEPIDDEDIPF